MEDEKGFVSSEPAIKGKYFAGRGRFYMSWLEIRYKERSSLDSKVVDLSQNKVDEHLFMLLSDILPPGGHMMVVYLDHEETARGLERGFPPMATPIGRSLWISGFTWFKDWYFPEGFMEGDVKLQGSKPLNSKDRVRNLSEAREELLRFLSVDENGDDLTRRAWSRATGLLREIDKELS